MDKNKTFGSREVVDFVVTDYTTGKPFLNAPWANTTATEITGEAVYAYGGQGHPKRIVFHGAKGGTFTFETQIQTMQLYSFISGAEIKTGANMPSFLHREEFSIAYGETAQLELANTPVTGSVNVFTAADDCGTALEVSVSTKTVTGTGITAPASEGAAPNKYVAYYMVAAAAADTGSSITITAKTFPKNVKIYGTTTDKAEDGTEILMRLIAYKAAPQPNFTINFTNNGDPVSLSVTCDLMADKDDNLLSLIADEVASA